MNCRRKTCLTITYVLLLISVAFISSADYQHQAFLKASNPDIGDFFGNRSIAISGDTLVVGTPSEDSDTTGVNGDESNNDALASGAVYVFTRTAGVWSQQAYLKASNTDANDSFGNSVAISGDTLIVGAPFEDSNASGVGGDESNNDHFSSGAAYIFSRSAGIWSHQAYLKASNSEAGDFFGWAVAISENKAVVGARLESSDSTGVNGNEINNDAIQSGAAYVFARNNGLWSQEAYLKASNTDSFDKFGVDVAISGQTIVVGANDEESDSTGINGDESNNDANNSGAAYVFVFAAGSWQQQAYLKASNTDAFDQFGSDVDISENTLIIGANREDSSSSGINSDESNNDLVESGAAYVFTRKLNTWNQQAYLKASNPDAGDFFASSVSLSNNTIVIGAFSEDSNATGIDGDQNNNDLSGSGAAYVYVRNADNWDQQNYLKSEFSEVANSFGTEVGVSGNTVVISEPNEGFIVSTSGAAYVLNQPDLYRVSVSITGLLSLGLTLQNNGADDLSILNDGKTQFDAQLIDGSSYQVTITNQPDDNSHTCITEGNSSGVISAANVLIKIRCADFIFVDDFE